MTLLWITYVIKSVFKFTVCNNAGYDSMSLQQHIISLQKVLGNVRFKRVKYLNAH